MPSKHLESNLRAIIWPVILFLCAALPTLGCDGAKDPVTPPPIAPPPIVRGAIMGRVIDSVNDKPVAGAGVRLRDVFVRTDADGRFRFTDLLTGPALLECDAAGFAPFQLVIAVTSDGVTQDIELTRVEVFELAPWYGEHALYVPASLDTVRGLILALGGPDTRGFATGKPLGAPSPAVEASLQALGQELRTLASAYGLAVIGTSLTAMADDPEWDPILVDYIGELGEMSRHPELRTVPVLVYGMSTGAPEAIGFTVRNPGRVAGLFLKVPSAVSSVTSGDALRVPTYVVLAELDAFVNNATLTTAFERNRGAGALWALATEPDVPHHSLTSAQRELTINWISTILDLRLPATSSAPLREIPETSGWLGNRATGEAAPWATYSGNRALASWLPSEATAQEWERFVAIRSGAY